MSFGWLSWIFCKPSSISDSAVATAAKPTLISTRRCKASSATPGRALFRELHPFAGPVSAAGLGRGGEPRGDRRAEAHGRFAAWRRPALVGTSDGRWTTLAGAERLAPVPSRRCTFRRTRPRLSRPSGDTFQRRTDL